MTSGAPFDYIKVDLPDRKSSSRRGEEELNIKGKSSQPEPFDHWQDRLPDKSFETTLRIAQRQFQDDPNKGPVHGARQETRTTGSRSDRCGPARCDSHSSPITQRFQ